MTLQFVIDRCSEVSVFKTKNKIEITNICI